MPLVPFVREGGFAEPGRRGQAPRFPPLGCRIIGHGTGSCWRDEPEKLLDLRRMVRIDLDRMVLTSSDGGNLTLDLLATWRCGPWRCVNPAGSAAGSLQTTPLAWRLLAYGAWAACQVPFAQLTRGRGLRHDEQQGLAAGARRKHGGSSAP